METLKLTEQIAKEIHAKVKAFDVKTVDKLRKAKDENGTFDVIISTEDTDRSGEIVKQNGWELRNYKNNPIVLWGHDYYSLPIGVCLETYLTEKDGVPALGARGVFLSADINPFAQQVRKLYEFGIGKGAGVGCTTSVGFIPKEFDENARNTITKAELLEFSFVPIPANQGVGPAAGRALTFEEAKELDLDVLALRQKGLEFALPEEKAKEPEEKEAQAGDKCSTDDGSPGVLTTDPKDPDGALVCLPQEQDKSAEKAHDSQKELLKALGDEHARHEGEVEDALDDFRTKSAVVEDQGNDDEEDDKKKAKKADERTQVMRESLKDLKSSLADEHTMHRAKSIAAFRSFNPSDEKAFEKKTYLKALRDEHGAYEDKNNKAIDDFEEKCMKSVQGAPNEIGDHTDALGGALEGNQKVHKKSVVKIAKSMCKEAFGEQEQADEKVLEILKGHLEAFVPEAMQRAVFMKVGAAISNATKNKLGEAHEHLKAAKAVLEALHPGLADGDGEESRSDEDKTLDDGSREPRSRPRQPSPSDEALKAHMQAKEIIGGIEAVARQALGKLNAEIRGHGKS